MTEDAELLRRYAQERSETAFAELVRRHINLVYASALRRVGGDTHLAEDVTQNVFTALAAAAARLSHHPVLAGWLHTTTRFAASQIVRTERRRQAREQEATTMHEAHLSDPIQQADWERLRPLLDEVLDELDDRDREAVLLRYLEDRSFAEVGAKLQLAENAARMRVERALDKMNVLLARRGVTSTVAALTLALANQAGVAAPAGLAATVTGTVLSGAAALTGAAAGVTFLTLKSAYIIAAMAGLIATFFVLRETSHSPRVDAAVKALPSARELLAARSAVAKPATTSTSEHTVSVFTGDVRQFISVSSYFEPGLVEGLSDLQLATLELIMDAALKSVNELLIERGRVEHNADGTMTIRIPGSSHELDLLRDYIYRSMAEIAGPVWTESIRKGRGGQQLEHKFSHFGRYNTIITLRFDGLRDLAQVKYVTAVYRYGDSGVWNPTHVLRREDFERKYVPLEKLWPKP